MSLVQEKSVVSDTDVVRDYTKWRQTHLPDYDDVMELSRVAEEFSTKLRRLGTDAIKEIASGEYETFEDIEAAIDAKLKANAEGPTNIYSPKSIREAGLKALNDALGPAGAILFMQQFDGGHGDYTKEKYDLPDESFDEIEARIRAFKEGSEKAKAKVAVM